MRDLGVDGVFLDTLKEGDPALVAALEDARPGIALESESTLPLARLGEHRLSWAQWFADSPTPGVIRTHYVERRHLQHHVRRWNRDHAEELSSAFLNGCGVMVWEVVFGVWVGWNARDAATLRRMLAVQRACADLLVAGEWTPLADLHPDATAAGRRRLDLVGRRGHPVGARNRGPAAYDGPLLPEGHGDRSALDATRVPAAGDRRPRDARSRGRGAGLARVRSPSAAGAAAARATTPSFPVRTVRAGSRPRAAPAPAPADAVVGARRAGTG